MTMTIFNVGVKAIIEKDDMVLLLHGGEKRDFWEGPGGRIDDDETIEQALRRELSEELPGIENVQVHELLYAKRMPGMPLGDKGLLLIWYRVTADFPKGVVLSDEHESYKWCTKEEVEQLASVGVWEAARKL